MTPQLTTMIANDSDVARAVFSPQMVNVTGIITRAAFSLRHNEDYISVCQMNIDSWLDDLKSIPQSNERKMAGYAVLNVGEIRSQGFSLNGHQIGLDVLDKSTTNNRSHAGIFLSIDDLCLKGDKSLVLKVMPADTCATPLLLRVQGRLLKLAKKHYVKWTESPSENSN